MRFSRRGVIIGLLIVLLGGGAVISSVKLLSTEQVLYLGAGDPGPDPFTEPAVFATANQRVAQVTTTTTSLPSVGVSPLPEVTSTLPEELAPSGASGECDRELLTQFLNEFPERRAVWAEAMNVPVGDIETFIRNLSPVVLTRDIRVSYFGFKEGEAVETQAILASGTAVLVNGFGEVVLRCVCGNPLDAPRRVDYNCLGCPDNFEPPPGCNGTCYEAPPTTTTLPATTTTTTTLLESTTTTTAAPSTVTRRRARATTTRPSATTTPTSRPPVSQPTGTLFPPNTATFPPPAPPTTTTSTVPPPVPPPASPPPDSPMPQPSCIPTPFGCFPVDL